MKIKNTKTTTGTTKPGHHRYTRHIRADLMPSQAQPAEPLPPTPRVPNDFLTTCLFPDMVHQIHAA